MKAFVSLLFIILAGCASVPNSTKGTYFVVVNPINDKIVELVMDLNGNEHPARYCNMIRNMIATVKDSRFFSCSELPVGVWLPWSSVTSDVDLNSPTKFNNVTKLYARTQELCEKSLTGRTATSIVLQPCTQR